MISLPYHHGTLKIRLYHSIVIALSFISKQAKRAAAEEAAKLEEEAERAAAEEAERARIAAEEEKARIAAEEERARIAAEEEAAKLKAQKDAEEQRIKEKAEEVKRKAAEMKRREEAKKEQAKRRRRDMEFVQRALLVHGLPVIIEKDHLSKSHVMRCVYRKMEPALIEAKVGVDVREIDRMIETTVDAYFQAKNA